MDLSEVPGASLSGLRLAAVLILVPLIVVTIAQVLFVEADKAIFVGEESGSCMMASLVAIFPGTVLLFAKGRRGLAIAYFIVGTIALIMYSVPASFIYACVIRGGCSFY